jgi:hypothetical protein
MIYDEDLQCWTMSARTYIKGVCERLEKLFGHDFRHYGSPMEGGDHPELDDSDYLDDDMTNIYQMMIGCAQWAVTIGRFDIQFATMSLARYANMPREGHLQRVKRLFGYLKNHAKTRIAFDASDPNLEGLVFRKDDWTEHYPDAEEDIPKDAPEPLTRPIQTSIFLDADHAHNLVTRRSVTGCLLCIGKAPYYWYCKCQNTVESSTYGSEFVAGRIGVEHVIAMRYNMRMLGIAVQAPTVMLIDNMLVVINSSIPSSTIKKKHNSIAYHKVREAVAAGIVKVTHVNSTVNIADLLTKALGPQVVYRLIKYVLLGRKEHA